MVIYASLLVALIGGVMYLLLDNPKAAEIGRLSFFAGLLAFLIQATPHIVPVVK